MVILRDLIRTYDEKVRYYGQIGLETLLECRVIVVNKNNGRFEYGYFWKDDERIQVCDLPLPEGRYLFIGSDGRR